ncbi:MAG: AraC family transcriptional regulator [Myxococcales bacterium]|nr:AraC family transcriptional regulator [Myxococcales bacterium]
MTANAAHLLFRYAEHKGHDPTKIAARFGLSFEAMSAADARITVQAAQAIWAELPAMMGDDNLGLHLAEHMAPTGGLLPVFVMASASTLGEGFERGLELQRTLAEGSLWRKVEPPPAGLMVAYYEFDDPIAAAPRHVLEFGMALIILAARRATGVDVSPAELRFRFERPEGYREAEALFRCPIRYGQPRDEMHFREETLALPVQTANPALLAHLESHGKRILDGLAPEPTFAGRVRKFLRDNLASAPTLDAVSRALGCAPRTVQRWLEREGTTLAKLYDRARFERACELLRDPTVGVRAVAIELGFSEQAAFHRAFVRWSGVPPGRWRAENSGERR